MEICLDRAWLNGFTQWDFQIVKKHFPSSHKEAGRVFLLNFTISHFNKHTIVRICLQANTKVGQKTCFLFFFVAFSSILVKEILIWNLNFYSCLHIYILCQKKKKKKLFSDNWMNFWKQLWIVWLPAWILYSFSKYPS